MVAHKEICVFKRLESCNSVFLNGAVDGGEENSFINGLGEKVHRATFHRPRWFEQRDEPCTLLVFIDDATSKLMQLRFVPSESTDSYFSAL